MAAIPAIASLSLTADASTVVPKSVQENLVITKSTPTHTIFLRCDLGANKVSVSKGSILALPEALKDKKDDFALVTAHGLPSGTDCYVQDFHGNSRAVKKRIYAKSYKAGTDTDWAIISFKKIKGQHIKRYNVDSYVSNPELLNNMPISFAQARGLPENNQNCHLALVKIPTSEKTKSVFTHDCRAIPGQSGSPITQNIDGKDKLIGFHLGQIWTLKSPLTGSPGVFRYMRPFDKNMSQDVKGAIKQLQAD